MALLPYRVLLGFESTPDKIRPTFLLWKSSPSISAGAELTRYYMYVGSYQPFFS